MISLNPDLEPLQALLRLAERIGGDNAKLRAATIAAIIIDIATARDILESPSLTSPTIAQLTDTPAPLLQCPIDPDQ